MSLDALKAGRDVCTMKYEYPEQNTPLKRGNSVVLIYYSAYDIVQPESLKKTETPKILV